ncbi:sensor histidine kinase [Streptococcus massiliensis]|uniref:histidine kinase n=1 Tax=Streptococcus massiliensis TaxID=313439 RepID=A0A380KWW6_9STRE|nr:HAMP domain-containing sensor histidine kinase [Streptococcus massiliensis]SUN76423.1 sensor protein [Streptococcus massiliensis]
MAVRTIRFRGLVWKTTLKIVGCYTFIFGFIGFDISQFTTSNKDFSFYRLLFWIGGLLLVTFYQIYRLLKEIDREIQLLSSKNLAKSEQSLHFKIKEFLLTYQDLWATRKEVESLLAREQKRNADLVLQLSATSHDLKTPLTVIQGNAELLGMETLPDQQAEYVAEILKASQKMSSYCASLIDYSKTFKVEKETFDEVSLQSFYDQLKEEVSLYDKEGKVVINCQVHEELKMQAHLDYLKRALLNIILNALDYASQKVTVRIIKREKQLVFSIWNDGLPFSQELLNNADRLFYQSDKSRNSDKSHYGIGLAFSKQVALLHDGNLKLFNPSTDGACVELSIKN